MKRHFEDAKFHEIPVNSVQDVFVIAAALRERCEGCAEIIEDVGNTRIVNEEEGVLCGHIRDGKKSLSVLQHIGGTITILVPDAPEVKKSPKGEHLQAKRSVVEPKSEAVEA